MGIFYLSTAQDESSPLVELTYPTASFTGLIHFCFTRPLLSFVKPWKLNLKWKLNLFYRPHSRRPYGKINLSSIWYSSVVLVLSMLNCLPKNVRLVYFELLLHPFVTHDRRMYGRIFRVHIYRTLDYIKLGSSMMFTPSSFYHLFGFEGAGF